MCNTWFIILCYYILVAKCGSDLTVYNSPNTYHLTGVITSTYTPDRSTALNSCTSRILNIPTNFIAVRVDILSARLDSSSISIGNNTPTGNNLAGTSLLINGHNNQIGVSYARVGNSFTAFVILFTGWYALCQSGAFERELGCQSCCW